MGTFKDLSGKAFGRLKVIKRGESALNTYGRPIVRWECECQCGKRTLVRSSKLLGGRTTSCGCFHHEQFGESRYKHGHAMTNEQRTSTYRAWASAKNRCTNPNNGRFIGDGNRGIRMCNVWLTSFENFLADMGEKPRGAILKRLDENEDFSPSNCRWVSKTK